jgi:hypothetical protein
MIGSGDGRPATTGGGASSTPTTPSTSGASSSSGALGTGLLIIGAVVGVLLLLWLLANLFGGQLGAGGLIFGLIILVVVAGPLLWAGWYLRGRAVAERAEADVYTARRAVLDNDRVVRRELARELEQRSTGIDQVAGSLPAGDGAAARQASGRLRDVMQDVLAPGYDSTTWLEQTAARLDAGKLDQLRRYDDLVLEEARRLDGLTRDLGRDPQAPRRLAENVDLLAQHVREREALLGRGERGSGLAPQEILAAGAAPRRRLETPLELRLEDAVSYQTDDYLVRGLITYFAGSRQWRMYQLRDGSQERWLEVRANGADLGWYELRPAGAAGGGAAGSAGEPSGLPATTGEGGAGPVTLDGVTYTPTESGSASLGVESAAGRREGVFVEFQRFRGPDDQQRLVVERWPDGTRVLVGEGISRDDLELWTKPTTTE